MTVPAYNATSINASILSDGSQVYAVHCYADDGESMVIFDCTDRKSAEALQALIEDGTVNVETRKVG